jgi:hypothetical protein
MTTAWAAGEGRATEGDVSMRHYPKPVSVQGRRSQGPPRSRGRRGSSRVLLKTGLILFLALIVWASTSVGLVSASPDHPCICPQCGPEICGGGGGSCPLPYSLSLQSATVTNATNSTVFFWLTSASGESSASAVLSWGTSTSYGYSQSGVADTSSRYATPLNFLDPNTKYDYKVTASTSCTDSSGTHTYGGSTSGSWTTGSDSATSMTGVIYNTAEGTAPPNQEVYLGCFSSTGKLATQNYAYTRTGGTYTVSVGSYSCASYAIEYENWGVINGQSAPVWKGEWNETIVVYAYGDYNLYVPSNYVSGFIPMTYDFTNSSYALFTVTSSSTLTTAESYALSVQGAIAGVGVGGGTSYSTDAYIATESSTPGVTGDSFVMQQEYDVSGNMVLNAVAGRAVTLFPVFYTPNGNIGSGPTTVSDWLPRPACGSDPGVVFCRDFEGSQPFTDTMTSGGSYTLASSFNVAVSESINIPGLGTGSASVSDSYTTSFTSSTSYSVELSVAPPSGVCYGFEYEFQGDNSDNYGVVAHVWNLGDQPQGEC